MSRFLPLTVNRTVIASLTGILLFSAAVAVIFPGEPQARLQAGGWCCVAAGQSCIRGFDAGSCGRQGGLAFSHDETFCTIACATPSATAASPQ
jgi:hypothetical protein